MANDVWAEVILTGENIEELKTDFMGLLTEDKLNIDDVKFNAFFKIKDPERMYFDSISIESEYIVINTWNAWNPKTSWIKSVQSYYFHKNKSRVVRYYLWAYDADNLYNLVNTDSKGLYFKNKFALIIEDNNGEYVAGNYNLEYDDYYESLNDLKTDIGDTNADYRIVQIPSKVKLFDSPMFVDIDGHMIDDPRY